MPGQRSAPSPVPTRYLHVPRRSMLHTLAHPASAETPQSCGTTTSVAATSPLPCAAPLTAHRNSTTTHNTHQKSPQSQQNQPPPHRVPSPPMCNTNRRPCPIDAPQTHPPCSTPRSVHVRLKIGPIQPGRPDVEARTTSSGSEDHLPHLETTGKQQTRNSATDLDAEYDRSRGRVRPISVRVSTDLDEGGGQDCP